MMLDKEGKKSFWSNLGSFFNFRGDGDGDALVRGQHAHPVQNPITSIVLFKDTKEAGRLRAVMRMSNNFQDRHGEIITADAHKEYVDWVDIEPENRMPEFWIWHLKGTRWGQADVIDYSDGFTTVSGLVDAGKEDIAKALVKYDNEKELLGVSHGFFVLDYDNKDKLIKSYRTYEVSPLPISKAANTWTGLSFALSKDVGAMNEEKRAMFIDLGLSEDFINNLEQANKNDSESLSASGIASKEVGETEIKEDSETESVTETISEDNGPQVSLTDILTAINTLHGKIGVVEQQTNELGTRIKALEVDKNEAVTRILEAAITPNKSRGFVASESKENEPTEKVKQENEDWLAKMFGVGSR